MTGGARPKLKGSVWERAVVAAFRLLGFVCERCYGAGRPDDVGDIELDGFRWLRIDAKNHKTFELAHWIDALAAKCQRGGNHPDVPALVVKRPGKGALRAYVILDLEGFAVLLQKLEQARDEREKARPVDYEPQAR